MTFATAPEAMDRLREIELRLDGLWALPKALSVSEWGTANLELTTGNRKGPWTPDPYQVEIMDAAADSAVRRVTWMKPAQVGWTLLCQVVVGHAVQHNGLPVLWVMPSAETAAKFAKDRLEPLIQACPALNTILVRPTAKNTGSTTRHKVFRNGGSILLASAGNPRELRSFQSALMVFDERSAWKVDLHGEGNPARLAEARGKTYPDLKIFEGSTPGALPAGLDPTEQSFLKGSQGRWEVPCPHCNFEQRLIWSSPGPGGERRYHLVFERTGKNAREVVPGSAAYACAACGTRIEQTWRWKMAQAGKWAHEFPLRTAHRSFHMTALSSVAGDNWDLLAQQWLDAQDDPFELKTFITLNLGEAWEDRGDGGVDVNALRARADREQRDRGVIPNGVGFLTCFVDVQGQASGNYLFATVVGWGADGESWLVDWTIIPGDVGEPSLWADLDRWLLEERKHEISGRAMKVAITLVDSGSGSHSDAVYSYVQPRQGAARRVFAARGVPMLDRPGLAKESVTKKSRVRLWLHSNPAWKQRLFGQLQRPNPGPGYMHLAHWATDEFLEQLTAEAFVPIADPKTKRVKGEWKQLRARNEAWDCWGGCLVGAWILQNLLAPAVYRDARKLAEEAAKPLEDSKPEPKVIQPPPNRGPRGGGMGGLGGGMGGFGGGGIGRGAW
ncbi:MAG: phage terminase large subunit family protein [Bacteroidetes bacterium]|nr:phage terminase large subunit family protein [Bacteroidota bacterium]